MKKALIIAEGSIGLPVLHEGYYYIDPVYWNVIDALEIALELKKSGFKPKILFYAEISIDRNEYNRPDNLILTFDNPYLTINKSFFDIYFGYLKLAPIVYANFDQQDPVKRYIASGLVQRVEKVSLEASEKYGISIGDSSETAIKKIISEIMKYKEIEYEIRVVPNKTDLNNILNPILLSNNPIQALRDEFNEIVKFMNLFRQRAYNMEAFPVIFDYIGHTNSAIVYYLNRDGIRVSYRLVDGIEYLPKEKISIQQFLENATPISFKYPIMHFQSGYPIALIDYRDLESWYQANVEELRNYKMLIFVEGHKEYPINPNTAGMREAVLAKMANDANIKFVRHISEKPLKIKGNL